ncbi:hypothetical protein [Devosia sp.]|uniref:hypothetical protein n=1 Tax=Devosia sp. TaxID=1871048 RepID=UPI001AC06538|nr:hypothetical protein [Devosia sp.]MBN9335633.1 hypothetical protein [Devosia sp.]
MQIFRLIGAALLVASISAFSSVAIAATAPAGIVFDSDFSIASNSPVPDCLASFEPSNAVLLVEAESGCDAIIADATGLCLVPANSVDFRPIVGVVDPVQGVTCTSIRPSPPG